MIRFCWLGFLPLICFFNVRSRDEDGEPLMDFDDEFQSDQEPQADNHLLDDEDDGDWHSCERSPTPILNESDSKSKRKKFALKDKKEELEGGQEGAKWGW